MTGSRFMPTVLSAVCCKKKVAHKYLKSDAMMTFKERANMMIQVAPIKKYLFKFFCTHHRLDVKRRKVLRAEERRRVLFCRRRRHHHLNVIKGKIWRASERKEEDLVLAAASASEGGSTSIWLSFSAPDSLFPSSSFSMIWTTESPLSKEVKNVPIG